MRPIDPAGFEQKYRSDIDPWNYRRSHFEAAKRAVLVRACGSRQHGRGLELGCSIGETTRLLARRCLRLVAVDSSPTALREAERRCGPQAGISFLEAVLPDGLPRGPFDLVVLSEIAYYLSRRDLRLLLLRVDRITTPGGRIVALHHLRPFDDAAQPPAIAQRSLRAHFAHSAALVVHERRNGYEAVAFQKSRRA